MSRFDRSSVGAGGPRRSLVLVTVAALIGALSALPATAQDVTLKLHQMLPPQAQIPAHFLIPWIEKVETESGGRIKIDHYPAMQLGGKPPMLFDQARDGVVDITWTVAGYTPGRFPVSEVFELPFMAASAEATSRAAWDFYNAISGRNMPTSTCWRSMFTGPVCCTSRATAFAHSRTCGAKSCAARRG